MLHVHSVHRNSVNHWKRNQPMSILGAENGRTSVEVTDTQRGNLGETLERTKTRQSRLFFFFFLNFSFIYLFRFWVFLPLQGKIPYVFLSIASLFPCSAAHHTTIQACCLGPSLDFHGEENLIQLHVTRGAGCAFEGVSGLGGGLTCSAGQ